MGKGDKKGAKVEIIVSEKIKGVFSIFDERIGIGDKCVKASLKYLEKKRKDEQKILKEMMNRGIDINYPEEIRKQREHEEKLFAEVISAKRGLPPGTPLC